MQNFKKITLFGWLQASAAIWLMMLLFKGGFGLLWLPAPTTNRFIPSQILSQLLQKSNLKKLMPNRIDANEITCNRGRGPNSTQHAAQHTKQKGGRNHAANHSNNCSNR
jgi:hypothetical protein